MARVTVTPDPFTMVQFEAEPIAAVVGRLADELGFGSDAEIAVEVDEENPLARARIASLDPLVLQCDSGALEDPKRPRHLSEDRVADSLGLLLVQAHDRLAPEFGAPPLDDELDPPVLVAWQVNAVGRLVRMGQRDQRPRRLYHFRNRHGFTDAADAAFERLWTAPEPLTFEQIRALSEQARTPSAPQPA